MDSHTKELLSTLQFYLSNLPATLPVPGGFTPGYGFDFFGLDDDDVADIGEEGALNRALEVAFGTRKNGPIVFTERGPGLEGVVGTLEEHLEKSPNSAILKKWVDDLITSAKLAFQWKKASES
ncbi:hypothetical protein BV22DRAFT_1041698 [Leucogyrophana mollusca]|uniref:Uncharacterized protein n=1 Tax=Leucogyrophana mollusca TaxID=85980 RepID=A0ACB8B0B9_9AGAM|nr:hypothetical protein BV22DRAFT_1041698 [Leucogyrophana mollusca]